MHGVVYLIMNLINGKIYIGQTKRGIEKRFKEHARSNSLIGRAIREYGKENFKCEILAECSESGQLNEIEKFYIAKFNCKFPNGYNFTEGGSGNLGRPLTDQARKNISMAQKKRFSNPKERESLATISREYHKNHKDSEETTQKRREAQNKRWSNPDAHLAASKSQKKRHQEHPVSKETISKRSKTLTGRKASEAAKLNMSKAQKKRFAEQPVSDATRQKQSESRKLYLKKIRHNDN